MSALFVLTSAVTPLMVLPLPHRQWAAWLPNLPLAAHAATAGDRRKMTWNGSIVSVFSKMGLVKGEAPSA